MVSFDPSFSSLPMLSLMSPTVESEFQGDYLLLFVLLTFELELQDGHLLPSS